MAESPVILGLIRKRAEVAGEVEKARAQLDRLLYDLAALDRVLELSGYAGNAAGIPRKTRGSKQERDAFDTLRRFIRATLESSPEPLRASEIARLYREHQGVTSSDPRTAEYYRYKVTNALRSMRNRGEAEMVGKGLGAVWRLNSENEDIKQSLSA